MNRWIVALRGTGLVVALAFAAPAAQAQTADLQAEAQRVTEAWLGAVASGDKAEIAAVLAPEFQIVRDNGVAYDRDGYLATGLPKIEGPLTVDKVVATSGGDVMVVRYVLVGSVIIDGAEMASEEPRLTTFRRVGDKWLVSSHANFAHMAQ